MGNASDSARFAEKAAENLPGVLYQFVVDRTGEFAFRYLSSGCRALYEREPAELLGDFGLALEIIHPEDRAGFARSVEEAVAHLQQWERELRFIMPSGAVKWIWAVSRPERTAEGDTVFSGVMLDITRHKLAERRLQDVIGRLSTPLIHVWDGVLVLPLIGDLDGDRVERIAGDLLPEISRRRARCVLLDFTGVTAFTSSAAAALHRTVQAIALLGGEANLTGMTPAVASAIVALGEDLGRVRSHGTLAQALARIVRA